MKFFEKLQLYSRLTDLASVSRRYFVIGFFDGVLTILGLILGAYLANELKASLVIPAGIATALALGISSGWGAYEAERIEQKVHKDTKEKAMLVELKDNVVERAHRFASAVSSFVHAISPILGALIPLIPFAVLPEDEALPVSLVSGLVSLFVVGVTLGRLARFNPLVSGLRMMLAGLATMVAVLVLNPVHI
ncbi:MAG: VIT1/CCC1 transporter family protein [Archaeoglobaceae archaeon]